jgi:hypothetical protein
MELLTPLAFAALLGIAALPIAILLLPFQLDVHAEMEDSEAAAALDVEWCWGALGLRVDAGKQAEVRVFDRRVHRFELSLPERKPGPKKPLPKPSVFVENRGLLLELLGKLNGLVQLRARVWGSVGLGRPDRTAYLATSLAELDAALPGLEIDVGPNYVEQSVLLWGSLSAFVWPIDLLTLAAEIALRRDTRQLLQALR